MSRRREKKGAWVEAWPPQSEVLSEWERAVVCEYVRCKEVK